MSGFVLTVMAQLLAFRADRDAFFTPVRVHCRSGLLGLVVEDVPIREVDEVLVDPLPHFPEIGNMTVQCRTRRVYTSNTYLRQRPRQGGSSSLRNLRASEVREARLEWQP